MLPCINTANFNKGCPSKSVDCERAKDDGLLLIFTSKLGITSLKQHRGHIGNLRRQIICYKGNSMSIQANVNNNPSSRERS